jgi:hypothetical protein
MEDFIRFPKIARFSREIIITEKIDGANAQVYISPEGEMRFGSRSRWITPEDDNHGFARWGMEHREELMALGPGRHFGEWWGQGINRGYGLKEKRLSLFNVSRWRYRESRPPCCECVPILWEGSLDKPIVGLAMDSLAVSGSMAAPGFMRPAGVVIYHTAANVYFKKTFEKDEGKGPS